MTEKNFSNTFFHFTKDQKIGLIVLFSCIMLLQILYYNINFLLPNKTSVEEQKWLSLQVGYDNIKANSHQNTYKTYPFNPNFITDFKGYKLGMTTQEIDKLLAFRKQGKFANSPKEFQQVTGISDSLLAIISPYFKFPDWVTNKSNTTNGYEKNTSTWKQYPKNEPIKVVDINNATKDDLMKISGIGDALSDKILSKKTSFGAFVSMDQLQDIWGLQPEIIEKLNKNFKIINNPNQKKYDINNASIKELSQFPYFNAKIAKNIVVYRSMNGNINFGNLSNIKDFPVDKLKIIALYLEF